MDFDYILANVFENNDVPISTEPLSPDKSTTYIADLNMTMKMLLNYVKREGHLNVYWRNV
jgi:hypothetical protein